MYSYRIIKNYLGIFFLALCNIIIEVEPISYVIVSRKKNMRIRQKSMLCVMVKTIQKRPQLFVV